MELGSRRELDRYRPYYEENPVRHLVVVHGAPRLPPYVISEILRRFDLSGLVLG